MSSLTVTAATVLAFILGSVSGSGTGPGDPDAGSLDISL